MSLIFSWVGNSLKGNISASNCELFKFWLISNVESKLGIWPDTRIPMKNKAEVHVVFIYAVSSFTLSPRNQISSWNSRRRKNNIQNSSSPHLFVPSRLLKDYRWLVISGVYFLVCTNKHKIVFFSAVTVKLYHTLLSFCVCVFLTIKIENVIPKQICV